MSRYAACRKQINKVNLTTYYPTVNYHLSVSQASYHDSQASYHYTTSDGKVDNKRELKRRKQYYFQINKLQGTFNRFVFPKYFEKITCRYGRTKALLYRSKQSIRSNKTSTPTLSLREAYSFSSQQNPAFNNTSAYSGKHPVLGESHYQTTNTQSYPAFLAFDYGKSSSLNYFGVGIRNLKAGTINNPAINYYIQRKAGNSSIFLNDAHLEKRMHLGKRIHLENRNGLSLSSLSLFFQRKEISILLPKKDVLEYLLISYSPSGTNSLTATEYSLTLSKTQNQIIRGGLLSKEFSPNGHLSNKFSPIGFSLNESSSNEFAQKRILSKGLLSNGIFLDRSFYDSVPLLSRMVSTASVQQVIQVSSLSNYASLIIPQSTVFASEFGIPSNTEFRSLSARSLGHQNAFISHFNERQKLNGQNVPDRKKARGNLSLKAGNRENANRRNYLRRHSPNSLRKESSSHQVDKNMYILAGSHKGQWIFSNTDTIHSIIQDFTQGMNWKNVFSAPTPEKKPEDWMANSKRLFSGLTTQGFDKTANSHLYPGSKSNNFVFPGAGVADQRSGTSAFGTSGKGRPELMHAGGTNYKAEREKLVYGAPQTLLDDVKKIEKVVFETKEAIVDHLESHLQQATGKAEQDVDIEYMSEKIMQMIDHRVKIEAERRGIFCSD
jgi:hypothetical protein